MLEVGGVAVFEGAFNGVRLECGCGHQGIIGHTRARLVGYLIWWILKRS